VQHDEILAGLSRRIRTLQVWRPLRLWLPQG